MYPHHPFFFSNFQSTISWIDIASLFVACIAIIFTIISLIIQRQHNRLSLRPIANIDLSNYENKIAVELINKGLGPLIIEKIIYRIGSDEKNNLVDIFDERGFKDIVWTDYRKYLEGATIPPNGIEVLIQYDKSKSQSRRFIRNRDKIKKILGKIYVEIHFKDIYGFSLKPATGNLFFFNE